MLLYFEPAFFCNVNDAWTFPELKARLWVTAAGSWIQLVAGEPRGHRLVGRSPGHAVVADRARRRLDRRGSRRCSMNVNPLIPLDGYFALSDWLEVPNLRQRAFAHLAWLVKTRVLRLDVPMPPADEREQRIFLLYGAARGLVHLGHHPVRRRRRCYGWISTRLWAPSAVPCSCWPFC